MADVESRGILTKKQAKSLATMLKNGNIPEEIREILAESNPEAVLGSGLLQELLLIDPTIFKDKELEAAIIHLVNKKYAEISARAGEQDRKNRELMEATFAKLKLAGEDANAKLNADKKHKHSEEKADKHKLEAYGKEILKDKDRLDKYYIEGQNRIRAESNLLLNGIELAFSGIEQGFKLLNSSLTPKETPKPQKSTIDKMLDYVFGA